MIQLSKTKIFLKHIYKKCNQKQPCQTTRPQIFSVKYHISPVQKANWLNINTCFASIVNFIYYCRCNVILQWLRLLQKTNDRTAVYQRLPPPHSKPSIQLLSFYSPELLEVYAWFGFDGLCLTYTMIYSPCSV